MKQRTFDEIMKSKALHRKHAAKHQANDFPLHRCKRLINYTRLITLAIANCKR